MLAAKERINFYEVLEVPVDAPQSEIHRAYQRAKSTYSQDNPALYSMFTREEARELLGLIEEAYSILGNHALRKNYDSTLLKLTPTKPALSSVVTHKALPDIDIPEIKPSPAPPKAAQPIQTVQPSDQNMGRCPLGVFKIDTVFEQEIADRLEFDGPYLKKIRDYKQVPMEKLSEASRIGKTYLIALESNDFKNLPAPVFLRGFLVQVARQLALDENKVVTSYMKLVRAAGK